MSPEEKALEVCDGMGIRYGTPQFTELVKTFESAAKDNNNEKETITMNWLQAQEYMLKHSSNRVSTQGATYRIRAGNLDMRPIDMDSWIPCHMTYADLAAKTYKEHLHYNMTLVEACETIFRCKDLTEQGELISEEGRVLELDNKNILVRSQTNGLCGISEEDLNVKWARRF